MDQDYRAPGVAGPGHVIAIPTPPAYGFISVLHVETKLPMRRTEYVTPGEWVQWVSHGDGDSNIQMDGVTTYERGKTYHKIWYRGPFAPRLDVPGTTAARRDKDVLELNFGLWSGANSWDYYSPNESDTGTSSLSVNGKLVSTINSPSHVYWTGLPADPADYELTVTGKRDWALSNEVRSTWKFRSSAADTRLPLLDVKYDLPLDELNRANGPFLLQVKAKTLKVAASLDGGTTWKPLAAIGAGDRWIVQPAGGQPGQKVSLHVTATDSTGGSVDQTLLNAYLAK
jgi:hypothetical protein